MYTIKATLMGEKGAEGGSSCTEGVLRFIAEVSETGCNIHVTPLYLPPNKTIIPLMNY